MSLGILTAGAACIGEVQELWTQAVMKVCFSFIICFFMCKECFGE